VPCVVCGKRLLKITEKKLQLFTHTFSFCFCKKCAKISTPLFLGRKLKNSVGSDWTGWVQRELDTEMYREDLVMYEEVKELLDEIDGWGHFPTCARRYKGQPDCKYNYKCPVYYNLDEKVDFTDLCDGYIEYKRE